MLSVHYISVLQFTDKPEERLSGLTHHFIRNPVRMLGEEQDQFTSITGKKERKNLSVSGQTDPPPPCCSDHLGGFRTACFRSADSPEAWSEVNTLRLAYSTPKVRRPARGGLRSSVWNTHHFRFCSVHRKDRQSISCLPCRAAGKLTAISTAAAATW